jgi:hypothetical protein
VPWLTAEELAAGASELMRRAVPGTVLETFLRTNSSPDKRRTSTLLHFRGDGRYRIDTAARWQQQSVGALLREGMK